MTLRLNGSTSGYVEIDAPATAGSNTLVLPTGNGTAQQVLATNGSGALSWSNRPILQVVSATYSVATSTTSGTFTDTGLSAAITPASSSNKILILVNQQIRSNKSGANDTGYGFRLLRDSTAVLSRDSSATGTYYLGTSNADLRLANTLIYLDSPATTSSTTYKTQINSFNTSTVAAQHDSVTSTITLLEVAA